MFLNKLKRKLQSGDVALGTLMATATPEFVEILGISGFDFVVIDTEHGSMPVEKTTNLIRAAELKGITPITRIRENDETIILRTLDVGTHGIQIPQINTKIDAHKAVEWSKYFPVGKRGVAIPRVIDFGMTDLNDAFRQCNQESMIIAHCESKEGYENLDDILKIPEIDVIFLGPYDMTQSLGIPGQFDHPIILEIEEAVVRKSKEAGKAAGIFVADAAQAKIRAKQGYQYITIQMFETLVAKACKATIDEFHQN
jgi:4-hydroxy-2-oxoheptanedioate aldolase